MTADIPLHFLSAVEAGRAVAARTVSATELTDHMLARIGELDPRLHAYATITPQRAVEDARRADHELDRGRRRGPLHGVPVAVKDLAAIAGIPTATGMPLRRDRIAESDSTVVARLAEAGAILLGSLQMTEGAYFEHHPDITAPRNPWGAHLWPGASSSGPGVAVAAGLAFAAIGSDTGGSIRFPAAANGIVGLKPTRGRVSRHGTVPAADSLDHLGPMTRTVPDAAAVLRIVAGHDPADPTTLDVPAPESLPEYATSLEGTTIGIDPTYCSAVDQDTASALDAARRDLERAGARVVELSIPDTTEARRAWAVICTVEAALNHAETYPDQAHRYGAIGDFLESGRAATGVDYVAAIRTREAFTREFSATLTSADALLVPTQPVGNLTNEQKNELISHPDDLAEFIRFATPVNMTGNPALTIPNRSPCGTPPASFQIVGRHLDETTILRIGHRIAEPRAHLSLPLD